MIGLNFSLEENKTKEQILTKNLKYKFDKNNRYFSSDFKVLSDLSIKLNKFLHNVTSNNDAIRMLGLTIPKSYLLNISKHILNNNLSECLYLTSKFAYNIGLISYADYHHNILKKFNLMTMQIMNYVKSLSVEFLRSSDIDNDNFDEYVKNIDFVNILFQNHESSQGLTLPTKSHPFTDNDIDILNKKFKNNLLINDYWKKTLFKFCALNYKVSSAHGSLTFDINKYLKKFEYKLEKEYFKNDNEYCDFFHKILDNDKEVYSKLIHKDYLNYNHKSGLLLIFKAVNLLKRQIKNNISLIVAQKCYIAENLIYSINCMTALRSFYQKIFLFHIPLAKELLILMNNIMLMQRKNIAFLLENKQINELLKLKNSEIISCGCSNKQSNLAQILVNFNQEIDLIITSTNISYTFKHQLKNILKVMKSRNLEEKQMSDMKYIRKSLKNMKLLEKESTIGNKSFFMHLYDRVRDYKEFSIKDEVFIQKLSSININKNSIIAIRLLKSKSQKILYLLRINPNPKKNVCFKISDQSKLNFLSDLILDFNKLIFNMEKNLNTSNEVKENDQQNCKRWWKER